MLIVDCCRWAALKFPRHGKGHTCQIQDQSRPRLSVCVRQPACSLPGGPRPKGRQKISSPSYRETYFPVILDVWQLACSIPGGSQLPNGQEIFSQNYTERFFQSSWMSGRLPAAFQEFQDRQMARTPSPTIGEKRISWPFWVSGSSPAASQEVRAARWPEFVPRHCRYNFLVILGVQQLSCSLPADPQPPPQPSMAG